MLQDEIQRQTSLKKEEVSKMKGEIKRMEEEEIKKMKEEVKKMKENEIKRMREEIKEIREQEIKRMKGEIEEIKISKEYDNKKKENKKNKNKKEIYDSSYLEQLTLRDQQFYIDKFKLDESDAKWFKSNFPRRSGVYKRLGQFDYGQPSCTTDHIKTCIQKANSWIYIGELKGGTHDTPHGIGIQVWRDGTIDEGYWKDGYLHGRGRHIDGYNGNYYIGEFKEGLYNSEGTLYYYNGDIQYEGGWKSGDYYGQGTYYDTNGDKYTGKWDIYKGQGEVNYKDGKKYIGEWDRKDYSYKRHGLGTLYSEDGQVLNQGKWEWNKYKGKE